jgi:hypothetical protein
MVPASTLLHESCKPSGNAACTPATLSDSRLMELLFYIALLTALVIKIAFWADQAGWMPAPFTSIPDELYWNRLEDLFNGWV